MSQRMQKAELFENLDIDVLRYLRDYPQVVKSVNALPESSPGSVYSQVNEYDHIYNRLVEEFRERGEIDKSLHEIVDSRQASSRPM